jgi:hypothetical protein
MFLEEFLPTYACRAAQQRQRPADDIWADMPPDPTVIFSETLLGYAFIRPVNPVRMAEPDGPALRLYLCELAVSGL